MLTAENIFNEVNQISWQYLANKEFWCTLSLGLSPQNQYTISGRYISDVKAKGGEIMIWLPETVEIQEFHAEEIIRTETATFHSIEELKSVIESLFKAIAD